MNIKNLKILSLIVLFISGASPIISLNNNLHTKAIFLKNRPLSNISTNVKNKPGRIVHKFTGSHLTSNNFFQQLKSQLSSTNININLKSSSNYNYAIKYENFDVFGTKHQGNEYIVTKNSKNVSINVGVKLLHNMKIRIGNNTNSQSWKNLSFKSLSALNLYKIIPTSISYSILATGSQSSPSASFIRSYKERSDPMHQNKKQLLGTFDVNNLNHSAKHFFTNTPGGYIVLSIIVIAILGIIAIGTFMKYKNIRPFRKKLPFLRPRGPVDFYAFENPPTKFLETNFSESTETYQLEASPSIAIDDEVFSIPDTDRWNKLLADNSELSSELSTSATSSDPFPDEIFPDEYLEWMTVWDDNSLRSQTILDDKSEF